MARNSNPSSGINAAIGPRILAWFDRHGRKDLPWQHNPTPYRVWVSEIMLQQTQVTTVIPYFSRFMERFPTLESLANSELNDVLHLWTGLGYYARGRNLHRCAQILMSDYHGEFPTDCQTLQTLPGIGRSTAGAILALSMNVREPILDGNVKRVLSRWAAISGWAGNTEVATTLWALAEQQTPAKRVKDYTQAMMDLGATVCTRTRPQCTSCPLEKDCNALQQGTPTAYPQSKPKKKIPTKHVKLLMLVNENQEIFLEKRPPIGIWGGLWSFPECDIDTDIATWCAKENPYGKRWIIRGSQLWPSFRHTFSHFHLDITPAYVQVISTKASLAIHEVTPHHWYDLVNPDPQGLSAPVKALLKKLTLSKKESKTH